MALNHHDINWVYSYQDSKDTGFYLRTMVHEVRLTSSLPKINKGLDEDFLIISRDRHDGYHCPVRDGTPSGVIKGLGFWRHFFYGLLLNCFFLYALFF